MRYKSTFVVGSQQSGAEKGCKRGNYYYSLCNRVPRTGTIRSISQNQRSFFLCIVSVKPHILHVRQHFCSGRDRIDTSSPYRNSSKFGRSRETESLSQLRKTDHACSAPAPGLDSLFWNSSETSPRCHPIPIPSPRPALL